MGIFTNFYWIIIVPIGVIVERLLFKVNFYRFDKLYYASIVEDEAGEETYDTPVQLAKAISQNSPWSWQRQRFMPMMPLRKL